MEIWFNKIDQTSFQDPVKAKWSHSPLWRRRILPRGSQNDYENTWNWCLKQGWYKYVRLGDPWIDWERSKIRSKIQTNNNGHLNAWD